MDKLFKTAVDAALLAGDEVMRIYGTDDFQVEHKADDSPLTLADKASNSKIEDILKNTGLPVLSEESKVVDYEIRRHWKRFWMVDPLDGTKEFIKRNGDFTVNIALIDQGRAIFGVVYAPCLEKLYFGGSALHASYKVEAVNSTSNNWFDQKQPIKHRYVEGVLRVLGSRSHMNQETRDFIEKLSAQYPDRQIEVFSRGSSLKFCLVAEGEADCYPRFGPTMEWDTAAAQAVCEGAACRVIEVGKNQPMIYNKENLLNPYFTVEV